MATNETTVKSSKPKATAKRKATVGGSIVAGVVVLLGGFLYADNWARQQVADYVTAKVQQVLSLSSDQPVTVNIGGTSVIAQVITGNLEQVDVGVDNVTIGDLTGGVTLRADNIPTDATKPVGRIQIEFRVGEQSLQKIAHLVSATAIDKVVLDKGEVQLTSQLKFFGLSTDVGLSVVPFASDGAIGFTPSSVSLNGVSTTAATLRQTFGVLIEPALRTHSVCVARWLPKGLGVDAVEVRGKELVVTIGAEKALFDDASLRQLGSCPKQ